MSTLTKEEREVVETVRANILCNTIADGRILVSLIDRLVAENEELRELKEHPQIYKHTARLAKENKELRTKLTALIEAAEPIVELIPKELREFADIGNSNYVNAKVSDLRNLNKTVKEAKGE